MSAILEGMATILWADAWADHVEETGCQSLSGVEITEAMPPIGEIAYRLAERIAGAIEQANGTNIFALLWRAAEADGMPRETPSTRYARQFGECLAFMALGHGVSWFDDHNAFDLKVPYRDGLMPEDTAEACGCDLEECADCGASTATGTNHECEAE